MTTVGDLTVACHRCKKQVLLSKCWAVHDKGLKTFECKDMKCVKPPPPPLPPFKELVPFDYSITKSLASKNTTFYIDYFREFIWKCTTIRSFWCWKPSVETWEQATEEEVEFLIPFYLECKNASIVPEPPAYPEDRVSWFPKYRNSQKALIRPLIKASTISSFNDNCHCDS